VDENPFVAITDKESYNLAKSQSDFEKTQDWNFAQPGKESQESILMTNGIKDFVKTRSIIGCDSFDSGRLARNQSI
jgi:hypothetical protein